MGAVFAAGNVPAEGCRAAALDGTHHLQLVEAHVAAIGFTPSGSMVAENIYRLIFQVVFAPFQGSPSRSTALRMTTSFRITAVATYLNG